MGEPRQTPGKRARLGALFVHEDHRLASKPCRVAELQMHSAAVLRKGEDHVTCLNVAEAERPDGLGLVVDLPPLPFITVRQAGREAIVEEAPLDVLQELDICMIDNGPVSPIGGFRMPVGEFAEGSCDVDLGSALCGLARRFTDELALYRPRRWVIHFHGLLL